MATATDTQSTANFLGLSLEEMKARIARFDERVNAAMAASPPTKELVRKAIRRQGAERCPVRMRRVSHDVIIRHGDDLIDLFCEYPDDFSWIFPYDYRVGCSPIPRHRLEPMTLMMQDSEWRDEWGCGWAHATGGVGPHPTKPAIGNWSELDDYLANRVPRPRLPGRMDDAIPLLEMHGQTRYCVGFLEASIFERMGHIRGSEEAFIDLYANESEVRRLTDRIAQYSMEIIDMWAEVGKKRGADGVFLGDDWGSQTALMVSPDKWREIYKPHYKALFDRIHLHGLTAIWHSCGNIMEIIPDLIDIGLDVLDPVQPGPLDIHAVAREFGGHISFSGGLDVQQFLIRSTPHQVKDAVRETIDTLGKPFGNGLIIAPSNHITPDVPIENLRAMFEACHGV